MEELGGVLHIYFNVEACGACRLGQSVQLKQARHS